ncbi:3'(2'),5'-bisphosphate nucleotidase CysQ [Alkalitalea saponilacus]|uniref:3'(2'),5'-bisphosphate nucleotidase CysQ n=1 Tax=Alkalitalea saponilacus TaxID=889453 RepID=A0A1T5FRH8_9BACT|nr:3'(2'),5'-bisphosphate nucleotidase CysQ [Alkalitalea saponilacus]ASB49472.1 3'(2'),5'-bisphosphate nucleotidase [Alkalitalea saponilacus]SKB98741.1 3'(2'), 5'-bisphosphate nucleotidase [Alkalitalea saponilacus]
MDFISTYRTAFIAALEAGAAILEVYNSNEFNVTRKSDDTPVTLADMKSHQIIHSLLESTNIPVLSEEDSPEHQKKIKTEGKYWLIDPLDGTREFISRNGEFTVNIALVENKQPVFGIIYIPCNNLLFAGAKNQGAYMWEEIAPGNAPSVSFFMSNKIKLPLSKSNDVLTVVASKSHLSPETIDFIKSIDQKFKPVQILQSGSSIKFCKIATGEADLYPRMDSIMEWDTAAGQAIIEAAGGCVLTWPDGDTLRCIHTDFRNPNFLAVAPGRECKQFFP